MTSDDPEMEDKKQFSEINRQNDEDLILMLSRARIMDGYVIFLTAQAAIHLETWRPKQDGRHWTDDIFKCIFFNEFLGNYY